MEISLCASIPLQYAANSNFLEDLKITCGVQTIKKINFGIPKKYIHFVNSLPNNKIFYISKLKAFAVDTCNLSYLKICISKG